MTPETLTIEAIVAGGDGLARRAEGPVVFVPRTAPGDRVEFEVVESHRQWARGRLIRVLRPGPGRREPACKHYERCGGCQLQHLSYKEQLSAKARIIQDSLRRLGDIDVDPPDVVASDREFEYRNRVSFLLRRDEDRVVAGFRALEDASQVVEIDICPLAEPSINRAWSSLREGWGLLASRLPSGAELRLTLRTNRGGEVGLLVEGGEGDGEPEELLENVQGLASIWRLDVEGEPAWYMGQAMLEERIGSHSIPLAGDAFVQVNHDVAAELEAYVLERCGEVAGQRIVDAYCGFGTRALELAWKGARVVGIDTDQHALAFAHTAAAESGAAARFVPAAVEDALEDELPADLVLLNPPRRGVAKRVIEPLLQRPPARVIYVSCDPATLARDLKALGAHYDIEACRAFDMFPQTAHVETVASLCKSTSPR